MREITKHQQQGVSLRAFAEQTGIREGQMLKHARAGRILGARKHPLTKKWWIYPPAKLLFPDSLTTYTRAVAVDVGTSPHGLNHLSTKQHLQGGHPPSPTASRAKSPSLQAAFLITTIPKGASPISPRTGRDTYQADALLTLQGDGFTVSGRHEADALLTLQGDGFTVSGQLAALAAAVDVGTSPHGLPAVLPPSVQETLETVALPLSGRPLLTGVSPGELPSVFAAPEVLEAIRNIKRGAGENHYPVVLSGSQMKLMQRAIFLATEDAIQAMSDEPHGRHDIQPDIDAYNQLYLVLKASKAAHKSPNESWREMEL